MLLDRLRANNEDGATAVEYAIMVSGIAMAIFATVELIGPALADIFSDPRLIGALTP